VQSGLPAAKKMRVGDPQGLYANIVDSPSGPMIAPPVAAQQPIMQVPLPLIVQIVNQTLVQNLGQQLVAAVHAPESAVKMLLAQGPPVQHAPPTLGAQRAMPSLGSLTGVAGSAVGASVESLPTLSTTAVPQGLQAGDALVCHENIGPSPSPPTVKLPRGVVAPSPPAPMHCYSELKMEQPALDADSLLTQPSPWYVSREKLVLAEFQKCLGQLAGVMRDKVAERDAKRQALAAQMMPRSAMPGGMQGNMPQGNMPGGGAGSMPTSMQGGQAGMPGMQSGMPGMQSGMPGMQSGMQSGNPGMQSGMPGIQSGMPGMQSGMPGSVPGSIPSSMPPNSMPMFVPLPGRGPGGPSYGARGLAPGMPSPSPVSAAAAAAMPQSGAPLRPLSGMLSFQPGPPASAPVGDVGASLLPSGASLLPSGAAAGASDGTQAALSGLASMAAANALAPASSNNSITARDSASR